MRPSALLAAALIVGWASTATAQSWPSLDSASSVDKTGANDVAVIVAVEDYAFLPDVPGAGRNAADWERFLTEGLGVSQVLMLTNQQAVREEILAFAEKAANESSEGGSVWFIFIGHGGPAKDGTDGLLIGADGQQNTKSMAARGLPQKQLIATLEGGKQARTIVLIDACFSGRDAGGEALAKGTMPVLPVTAAPEVAVTTVVMTAAQADEFAGDLPGADRPAFSYLMLGAMRGWADDGDGEVTAAEAVAMSRRELLGIAGRQQTPQLVGGKNLVLTRGVSEARPSDKPVDTKPVAVRPGPADASAVAAAEVVDPASVDGVPDNAFYVFASPGVGVIGDFSDLGFFGDFGAGVKTNGFTGGSNEWRIGLRAGLATVANSSTPSEGQTYTDGSAVDSTDTIPGSRITPYYVGPELAYAWRRETGPALSGDTVFSLGLAGLYGQQKRCSQWSLDTSSGSREVVCSGDDPDAGPGAAFTIAANAGVFRFGAILGAIADIGAIANLTVGLTFDK